MISKSNWQWQQLHPLQVPSPTGSGTGNSYSHTQSHKPTATATFTIAAEAQATATDTHSLTGHTSNRYSLPRCTRIVSSRYIIVITNKRNRRATNQELLESNHSLNNKSKRANDQGIIILEIPCNASDLRTFEGDI